MPHALHGFAIHPNQSHRSLCFGQARTHESPWKRGDFIRKTCVWELNSHSPSRILRILWREPAGSSFNLSLPH
jgi:hypothetical protein